MSSFCQKWYSLQHTHTHTDTCEVTLSLCLSWVDESWWRRCFMVDWYCFMGTFSRYYSIYESNGSFVRERCWCFKEIGIYLNFQFRFCLDCLSWYSSTGLLSCGNTNKGKKINGRLDETNFLSKEVISFAICHVDITFTFTPFELKTPENLVPIWLFHSCSSCFHWPVISFGLRNRINYSVKGKMLWEDQIIAGLIDCGDVWFNRVWLPVAVITHGHWTLSFMVHYAPVLVVDDLWLFSFGVLWIVVNSIRTRNKREWGFCHTYRYKPAVL